MTATPPSPHRKSEGQHTRDAVELAAADGAVGSPVKPLSVLVCSSPRGE